MIDAQGQRDLGGGARLGPLEAAIEQLADLSCELKTVGALSLRGMHESERQEGDDAVEPARRTPLAGRRARHGSHVQHIASDDTTRGCR